MLSFLVVALVLLPYISPGLRFPTEVQPWAALAAWALLGLRWFFLGRPRLERADWALLGLSVVLALYVRPENLTDPGLYLRKSVGFTLSIAIYLLARDLRVRRVREASVFAVGAYLTFGVLQYVANSAYSFVIPFLVPIAPQFGDGRGASSLSPEATDFGFTAVFLFVLVLVSRNRRWPPPLTAAALGAPIACVLMSKSGSGVIALAIVSGVLVLAAAARAGLPGRVAVGLGLSLAGAAGILLYDQLSGVRGVQLLVMMVSAPGDLLDTTFVYRFVHNWAGVMGLIESRGLGYGAGSFVLIAPPLYANAGLGATLGLSDYYLTAVAETLAAFPAGVIPMLLLEYGVLGLSYIGVVAYIAVSSGIRHRWAVAILLALAWLQSFPVAYPPFWLLLGLCRNPHFAEPRPAASVSGSPVGHPEPVS